jgi:hypothetical protein
MASGIRKVDDEEWLREQIAISKRMNEEHLAKFDRSFLGVMSKIDAADDGDDRNRNDGGSVTNHPVVQHATLLVATGKFPDHAQALDYLLNTSRGQAHLSRMSKGKDHSTMDRTTELRDVAKAKGGVIAIAKAIIDEQRGYGISEAEFVELATEHAKAQHPELTDAQAFEKLYANPMIWRACNLLKSMPIVADITPLVVGGPDAMHAAMDDTEQSEAYAQLQALGQQRWPNEQSAIQFSRASEARPDLLAKAHVRPVAPASGMYPFPV